jgi:hypothetical protein
VEEARYYADGAIDARYRVTFDERGNPIERIKYRGDDAVLEKHTYECEFDSAGNWVKKKTTLPNSTTVEVTRRTIAYW